MAGFRGQGIHYLHCGRNCRTDELWNSKSSETGKRAGQQQWDWIDREETSGTGKTECYLCEKFYDQRGSRPKANRELCRFAI